MSELSVVEPSQNKEVKMNGTEEYKEVRIVSEDKNNLDNYFPNEMSKFIFYRTYSRWRYDLSRRETWVETVDRVINFFKDVGGKKISNEDYELLRDNILTMKVMPSMRLMWTAGEAAKKNNFGIYNCSYLSIDNIHSWAEIMFILMHGTGVGYSVEMKCIEKLPTIKEYNGETKKIKVLDSKDGWATSLARACESWWDGYKVEFDYSKIRPSGSILKTFGGRASGPQPLKNCYEYFSTMIERHRGRKLSTVNCHDLSCKVAEAIVVGGVRRSAMISLSDLHDEGMRNAKQGQFWMIQPQRAMSNNSAVYKHKPSSTEFMKEWLSLAESGTGERGLFNRGDLEHLMPKRRRVTEGMGVNPCSEIILRDHGLCNLSEVIIRAGDTMDDLFAKVKTATILGTLQSALTDFGNHFYLSDKWKKNAEQERLLGVSMTGQMDNPEILTPENLESLRDYAIGVNVEYARKLGIKRSAAITCSKPSGTVSQLVDSASGFHPRYSKFYIRRIRISATDPLFKMMRDQGFKFVPEVGQSEKDASTWVIEFPIKSPDGCITRNDLTALEQLEQWLKIKKNWAEHTVSATIYVDDGEWLKVGNWVYDHFSDISGISFLPKNNHIYQLAPYEEITEKVYLSMLPEQKSVDYSKLSAYEQEDWTEGAQTLACVGDRCELK